MNLSLRTDRSLIRAGARSRRYVLATIVAPEAPPRAGRLPVNVALVLDRSGSMAGARKFALARDAVEQALRLLGPDDRFALVVYDDAVDVLARSTQATPEAKRRALDALRGVEPRGSTDLCAGWMRGCEQVADALGGAGIARALLLTDGLANHGETDPHALARHGIATSTFGVGDDFDERLLRDLAHEGGGTFYFIEHPAQIPDLLTSELGEALSVVVRGATLTVELPADAGADVLNRFRSHIADGALRIELGDLVSGQEVQAVVRVRFGRRAAAERARVRCELAGDATHGGRASGTLEWTYASHAANDEQLRDVAVDREVARLYSARARAEATEANRRGDVGEAQRVLDRTAARVAQYAGADAELQGLAESLREDVPLFAAAMAPRELKRMLFRTESAAKGRAPDGKARRR